MKKILTVLTAVMLTAALSTAGEQPAKKLKVFISVDMEGVSGLIHWDETGGTGPDYGLFRKLMTAEANAAIAGALEAGAT
ncbi:MAG: M55 family metallopeptidase, partial [Candidatus Aminicenantes bacterium]|nr:M55 family metallopeptidase [Candidatus Aminicenantes bacterium]